MSNRIYNSKPGWLATIIISLISPIIILLVKEYLIDRPKERVDLTYDINQPLQHLEGEYLTYIEVVNIGLKETGDSPITLIAKFKGKILEHQWKKPLDKLNIISEKKNQYGYTISFKRFGSKASCIVIFKSEEDLSGLPILKYNEIVFPPRVKNTLNKMF